MFCLDTQDNAGNGHGWTEGRCLWWG